MYFWEEKKEFEDFIKIFEYSIFQTELQLSANFLRLANRNKKFKRL